MGVGVGVGVGFGRWAARLGLRAALALPILSGGETGCASMRTQQVERWETEGNLEALKTALDDDSPEVRAAAAQVLVRYGAYDTGRPPVLGMLNKSEQPEAKQAAKQLFGVPPQKTPDPFGKTVPAGTALLYLYRPADDETGEARWIGVDGHRTVRLEPGRFFRVETRVGSHRLSIELPDEEAQATDDPSEHYGQMRKVAPMQFVVSAPASGVYFVRYQGRTARGRPGFAVMPVPPGMAAVKSLVAASQADTKRE